MSDSSKRQSSYHAQNLKKEYLAFISYRHLDNQQYGRQWATWLHQSIESYEVPEDLVGFENELGFQIPETLYPIFRDEDELPADADLAKSVISALERSSYLIVICSPRSVTSEYVCAEIAYFKKIGRSDRILSVMIEGEPNASWDSGKHKAGFKPEQECLPLPLRHPVDARGEIDQSKHAEPIAADFRLMPGGQQGWTTPAAYREALQNLNEHTSQEITEKVNAYQKELVHGLYKVLAGVMGVPLRTLTQRDKAYQLKKERRRAKVLRRWLTAIVIFAVVAIVSGIVAWEQRGIAKQNELTAQKKTKQVELEKAKVEREKAKVIVSEKATQKQLAIAESNLGVVFASKAERALEQQEYNSAHLYALQSLRKLDPETEESTRAKMVGLTMSHSIFPTIFQAINVIDFRKSTYSVAVSPDGRLIAWGAPDDTIRLWSVIYGVQIRVLKGHTDDVRSIAFSPDGLTIVSGALDQTVRLWNVATGKQKTVLKGHSGGVFSVSFSPDGKTIVSGAKSADFELEPETMRLWDVASGKQKQVFAGYDGDIFGVAFSPDSKTIVVGARNGTVCILDVSSFNKKIILKGHTGSVGSVSFSPDGHKVVSGASDNTIRLWDVSSAKQKTVLKGHTGQVESVAFSPDGKTIVSGARDNTVRLWDVASETQKAVLTGHLSHVYAVSYSLDGQTIVSGASDGTIRMWDVSFEKQKSTLEGHSSYVNCVAFSLDGRFVVSGSIDSTVRLWDLVTGKQKAVLKGHSGGVFSVSFSPDGKTIVSGAGDKTVRLWDVATGKEKAELKGHTDVVESVAFSPDSTIIVSGSRDKTVCLWDVESKTQKAVLAKHRSSVENVEFSSDGRSIISRSKFGTVRLWDVGTQKQDIIWDKYTVDNLLAFSPDGQTSALGMIDYTVVLRNVENGKQKAVLTGHTQFVTTVAFSLDGRTIVSGASDDSVRLWNVQTGKQKAVLEGHTDGVNSVAFSADGKTIASGSDDNSIRTWRYNDYLDRLPTEQEIADAQNRLGLKLEKVDIVPADIPTAKLHGRPFSSPRWPVTHPFHWILRAEAKDANAMTQLGLCYDRNSENDKALKWCQKAADAGDAYGKERLAFLKQWLKDQPNQK
ncbi:TIR domain-containing protein [uncultured Gimesia sp.]|uniref:TIR domain-containing protein n=1 Tax=uncultured Gimesia sp. TaxID=1678688 RepID=UPI002613DD42|nr:TIR domain-containing protein [uncultured Gimesia sp.]